MCDIKLYSSFQITLLVALFAFVHAGHEAPPPKAHTYSVPSVAKVEDLKFRIFNFVYEYMKYGPQL